VLILSTFSLQSFFEPERELTDEQMVSTFKGWNAYYLKEYESDLHSQRTFDIFKNNYSTMVKHNSSGKSWRMGLNEFAGVHPDEFKKRNGFKQPENLLRSENTEDFRLSDVAPATQDWRNKGVLTPVKDQQQCGSCWAFSAIETLESREKMAGKPLKVLSEEELVDCDTVSDHGCEGGIMQNAYTWLETHGIDSESD
jgi:hypothetical protein